MVAAVEIVVDEDLPVAVEGVGSALEEVQGAEVERSNAGSKPAQKFCQRRGVGIEIDEDELLPGFDLDRNQPILRAVEAADAFELGRALERAVEAVAPAVIGTAKNARRALLFRGDCRCVMAADVEEGAQLAVAATNDEQRLAGELRGDELPGALELIGARDYLPGAAEDAFALRRAMPGAYTMKPEWWMPDRAGPDRRRTRECR